MAAIDYGLSFCNIISTFVCCSNVAVKSVRVMCDVVCVMVDDFGWTLSSQPNWVGGRLHTRDTAKNSKTKRMMGGRL
jgi:hypothetical protein